jgi:hypothetical protein
MTALVPCRIFRLPVYYQQYVDQNIFPPVQQHLLVGHGILIVTYRHTALGRTPLYE